MVSRVTDDSAKPDDPSSGTDNAAPVKTAQPDAGQTASRKTDMSTTASSSDTKKSAPRRRRKTASKSGTRKSITAASLKADLETLETRVKRADGVTRKSVESLENIVSALEAGLKKSNTAQKGRLTRHVNSLTERLDQQTQDMRAAVRTELKAALAEGSLSDLDAALGRASLRLDKAEVSQADAIARVNKHLADIARAIDARMKAESETRRKELDTVTEQLTNAIANARMDVEERVTAVERDSAQALTQVGDTIEKIHTKLEQRRQASNDDVVGRVNELGQQTQAELTAYQAKLETRLAEMEARHLAVGTGAAERVMERASEDIRHRIDSLQKRIVELESRPAVITAPQMAPLPPLPDTPSAAPQTTPGSGPTLYVTPTDNTSPPPAVDAHPNPIQTLRDRLTSFRAPAVIDNQNPYAAALQASNDAAEHEDTLTLDRMVPPPVQFAAEPPQTVAPPAPIVQFPGQTSGAGTPPLPPFQMPSALPPLTPAADFESAPMPDAVYSNPAYAESVNARAGVMARTQSDSPMAVRVTGDSPRRSFALPDFSNRNLRVGLLAAGAVLVALLAGRMILGSGDGPNPDAIADVRLPIVVTEPATGTIALTDTQTPLVPVGGPEGNPENIDAEGAIGLQIPPDTSTQPIGNYAENQPVVIDAASLDTLEAAVEAGNPIAQFQMGLAKLDAGQTDEGAALVRQAASANQPAALYRLAKLYEAGEGVPRDDVMARQLIERAARGGNRIAMHDLALYYTEGRGGVELNMGTAKSWFEQAAQRGVVDSQFNLAILSESTEIGTTPNIEDALFWYAIAARQGDQFAVSRRDALRETLSGDQVEAINNRITAFAPRQIDQEANGIFNDVPWIKTSQTSNRSQVREAQTLLANLGYPVGTPDGLMGARTRKAIADFERANGLAETGQVSPSLINRLANAAGA